MYLCYKAAFFLSVDIVHHIGRVTPHGVVVTAWTVRLVRLLLYGFCTGFDVGWGSLAFGHFGIFGLFGWDGEDC